MIRYNKILCSVLFIIFLLSIYSCINKNNSRNLENSTIVTEALFNIDTSLLGLLYANEKLDFQMHIPKNWLSLTPVNLALVNKGIQSTNEFLDIKKIYRDTNTESAVMVIDITGIINNDIDSNYFNSFQTSQWEKIEVNEYLTKPFKVRQYTLQNQENIVFKLFFMRHSRLKDNVFVNFEIDFIIPRLMVEQSVKSVESSIGSINYLLKSKNETNNE